MIDGLKLHYEKKREEIQSRLNSFKELGKKEIFYELCFCTLTVQSNAWKCDEAVKKLIKEDFYNKDINPHKCIKEIRFHNNKAKRLREIKKNFHLILDNVKDNNVELSREWLVNNVNGYGYKESSHFLRNIGHKNLAILDRHILKNLVKYKIIEKKPKTLTRKKYFEIENKFREFSKKVNIPMDHLDLFFWSQETGKIFK